jgi:GalNAc-alpha-(1->4)-GalNAc-alpha-(1->3)-diNAcBac-PP-undecaprenol alpha-1,4-N-acetyl-D-galactosaminyltransferase
VKDLKDVNGVKDVHRTKRILFIVPSLKAGGLERVAALLANTWVGLADADRSAADANGSVADTGRSVADGSAAEFDVTLLTLDAKLPFYDIDPRVKFIQAPREIDRLGGWRKAVGLWRWLPGQAKAIQPDVILSFGEGYNAFVMARLGFLKCPVFLGNRTTPLTSLRGVRGFINPIFYKKATRVFVQTQRSMELLMDHYRGTSFSVIPNPIEEVNITPDLSQKTILNVGSLGGKKNQGELIEIFAGLRADFPEWKLVFAGDGPNRAMLEEEVRKRGLQGQVEFRGVVRDLASLYQEASIFAFTSLLEGFPNALGEAIRAGLPVIAYDCITGPSELISHGVDGFLVSLEGASRDVVSREAPSNEYKVYLSKLMASRELRESFGRNGRQNTEDLNPERIAKLYLAHFRKALSHQPA